MKTKTKEQKRLESKTEGKGNVHLHCHRCAKEIKIDKLRQPDRPYEDSPDIVEGTCPDCSVVTFAYLPSHP